MTDAELANLAITNVADVFRVDAPFITGPSRSRRIAEARAAAAMLMHRELRMSLVTIAEQLHRVGHHTIADIIRTIEARSKHDFELQGMLDRSKTRLRDILDARRAA